MRFSRKALYFVAGVSVLAAAGWSFGRVPYHRWRLAAATRAADRIRAGDYRLADDFIYLLRGEPKTGSEYEETIVLRLFGRRHNLRGVVHSGPPALRLRPPNEVRFW